MTFEAPSNDTELVNRTLSAMKALCPNKREKYQYSLIESSTALFASIRFSHASHETVVRKKYLVQFEFATAASEERRLIHLTCSEDGIVQSFLNFRTWGVAPDRLVESVGDAVIPQGTPAQEKAAREYSLELLESISERGLSLNSRRNNPPFRGR